jgi:hypothetical protein
MQRIIIVAILFVCFSCKKEDTVETVTETKKESQVYIFSKSDFTGNIECYDSSLTKIENTSLYTKNDFLFADKSIYPYQQIEIYDDSTVYYQYTIREVKNTDKGYVTTHHDSLFFFITNRFLSMVLFSATITDGQLKIPAYGYKVETGDGSYFNETQFGYPNSHSIKNKHFYFSGVDVPGLVIPDYDIPDFYIFIQKFDLTYQKD